MGEARRRREWRYQGYDPREHWLPGGAACLNCGLPLTGALSLHHRNPRAYDYSVCSKCGHVAVFTNARGGLRPPTDEELVEIAGSKDLLLAQDVGAQRRKLKAQ